MPPHAHRAITAIVLVVTHALVMASAAVRPDLTPRLKTIVKAVAPLAAPSLV